MAPTPRNVKRGSVVKTNPHVATWLADSSFQVEDVLTSSSCNFTVTIYLKPDGKIRSKPVNVMELLELTFVSSVFFNSMLP